MPSLEELAEFLLSPISKRPDRISQDDVINYDLENKKEDLKFKKSYLIARKRIGLFICVLVAVWLFVMIYIVLSDGINRLIKTSNKFDVSDTVIVTLVTTTTLNILVLLNIVVSNLFPSPGKSKTKHKA